MEGKVSACRAEGRGVLGKFAVEECLLSSVLGWTRFVILTLQLLADHWTQSGLQALVCSAPVFDWVWFVVVIVSFWLAFWEAFLTTLIT